jgi:hypothetical protein
MTDIRRSISARVSATGAGSHIESYRVCTRTRRLPAYSIDTLEDKDWLNVNHHPSVRHQQRHDMKRRRTRAVGDLNRDLSRLGEHELN